MTVNQTELWRSLRTGACVASLLLCPAHVTWAQQNGGIAGVVRDTGGLALPGVVVEAASPALIEKVRSVVSDGEGRYNIVDLRPGTYSITFALAGFSTVRREGIELSAGFEAPVTVIVSEIAPIARLTFTGATNPALSSIPSRRTVEKPARAKVME